MNKLIKNWFRLYDQGTITEKAKTGALKTEPLKPIKPAVKKAIEKAADKKPLKPVAVNSKGKAEFKPVSELPTSYADLLALFNKTATAEEKKTINGGNNPKKAQILNYFNGTK